MSARIVGVLAMVMWTMVALPAAAQSLGEVARKEAARRERIKSGGKVLTNADLPASAVLAPPQDASTPKAADDKSAGPPAEGAAAETAVAPPTSGSPAPPKDDEEGWRGRASKINAALAEARAQARQLSALSDRLALEMQATDRSVAARAAREREDVKVKLAEAEAVAAKAQATREAFVQEARVAGVPPAWIQ